MIYEKKIFIIMTVITVLYSSQSRMLKGPLSRLIKEVLPEHDDLNYVDVDMSFAKLIDLSNECLALPIGYDKKAIVAENFFYLAKTREKKKLIKGDDDEPLLAFFRNPDPLIHLFILVYSDSLDEKSVYYKALAEGDAKFLPVASLDSNQWQAFIPKYFEKHSASIEELAVNELLERTGGDYSLFIQEANKLLAYTNGDPIRLVDVQQLVPAPLEDDIFLLSNALTKGDKKTALHIWKDMQVRGSASNAIPLMNMLANQFVFLDQIRYLYRRGMEAYDISSKLKCSLGRVKACLYNVRKMASPCLHRAINQLYVYQSSVFQGKMTDKLAFEMFIANFEI